MSYLVEAPAMALRTMFFALGHRVRFEIFSLLRSGSITTCCGRVHEGENAACVADFVSRFPKAQATISHHLRILEDAGLITSEKRGQFTIYRASEQGLAALKQGVMDL
jgi:ArsR family transcriptional regulator